MSQGALPIQEMEEMIHAGYLTGFPTPLQPASADMSIDEEAYRVRGSICPLPSMTVRELLKKISIFPHDLEQPLEPGATYFIRSRQSVSLPEGVYGYCNPKSSTGRVDLHVRLVADGVMSYDTIPAGFNGELWFVVSSHNFLAELQPGEALSQARFFDSDTRLDETSMQFVYNKYKLLWLNGKPIPYKKLLRTVRDGSLCLTLDLKSEKIVGYRAKQKEQAGRVLELAKKGGHKLSDFFEPIPRPESGMLLLEQGRFYILVTRESVRVPPQFACEMVAIDERMGEYRSHYAGFIDPGWGCGNDGKMKGAPLVLEMRPFEQSVYVTHGGPVCRLRYERMRAIPRLLYGMTGSHYANQKGPRLSKHFKKG